MGKAEGDGLARAGLGPSADVLAGEYVGDRHFLDREGRLDAGWRRTVREVVVDAERGESIDVIEVRVLAKEAISNST